MVVNTCGIMSNMRQVSGREAQRHLARVLTFVQDGEEIEITAATRSSRESFPAAGKRGVVGAASRPDYHARLSKAMQAVRSIRINRRRKKDRSSSDATTRA